MWALLRAVKDLQLHHLAVVCNDGQVHNLRTAPPHNSPWVFPTPQTDASPPEFHYSTTSPPSQALLLEPRRAFYNWAPSPSNCNLCCVHLIRKDLTEQILSFVQRGKKKSSQHFEMALKCLETVRNATKARRQDEGPAKKSLCAAF